MISHFPPATDIYFLNIHLLCFGIKMVILLLQYSIEIYQLFY